MKKLVFAAVVASLILPSAGIQAKNTQTVKRPDIVVSSGRSIGNFVEDVAYDINRELNRPQLRPAYSEGSGVSQVLFECGPDGKPVNLKMYHKAGSPAVDRAARRAVSKIRSLHPLPQGVGQDQLYLANIIIAENQSQYDDLAKELNQREARRIAAAKGDRKIFAFNLGASPST